MTRAEDLFRAANSVYVEEDQLEVFLEKVLGINTEHLEYTYDQSDMSIELYAPVPYLPREPILEGLARYGFYKAWLHSHQKGSRCACASILLSGDGA